MLMHFVILSFILPSLESPSSKAFSQDWACTPHSLTELSQTLVVTMSVVIHTLRLFFPRLFFPSVVSILTFHILLFKHIEIGQDAMVLDLFYLLCIFPQILEYIHADMQQMIFTAKLNAAQNRSTVRKGLSR